MLTVDLAYDIISEISDEATDVYGKVFWLWFPITKPIARRFYTEENVIKEAQELKRKLEQVIPLFEEQTRT